MEYYTALYGHCTLHTNADIVHSCLFRKYELKQLLLKKTKGSKNNKSRKYSSSSATVQPYKVIITLLDLFFSFVFTHCNLWVNNICCTSYVQYVVYAYTYKSL